MKVKVVNANSRDAVVHLIHGNRQMDYKDSIYKRLLPYPRNFLYRLNPGTGHLS